MAADISNAACEQVNELVKAGILQPVQYKKWVANLVVVKKRDGK